MRLNRFFKSIATKRRSTCTSAQTDWLYRSKCHFPSNPCCYDTIADNTFTYQLWKTSIEFSTFSAHPTCCQHYIRCKTAVFNPHYTFIVILLLFFSLISFDFESSSLTDLTAFALKPSDQKHFPKPSSAYIKSNLVSCSCMLLEAFPR